MDEQEKQAQFDQWSSSYDSDVLDDGSFPFDGYGLVLDRVVELAAIEPGMDVLELGPGTGNLTGRLVTAGAAVWAIDFSAEMLARAKEKVPAARLAQAHLLDEYPPDFRRPFDLVVSTYTFHELPLTEKLILLRRLVDGYLRPDGAIVIGDIGFASAAARDAVKSAAGETWDEEYYWLREETAAACRANGLSLIWEQLSSCGAVMLIKRDGRYGEDA